ncbi:MAG: Ppx/GppA phosphatase family protein [Pseudomonadota bacterium]
MTERSGRDGGNGAEPPHPGRSDRNFGKRQRRRKKRRQQSGKADQPLQPGHAKPDEVFHSSGKQEGSVSLDGVSAACGNASTSSVVHKDEQTTDSRAHRKKKNWFRNRRHKSEANSAQSSDLKTTKPAHREHPQRLSAYAALDLGTNNCRLLIAVPRQHGRFRVIDGFSRIVRLGEGLSQTGLLSDAAMDRAVEALKICASKLGNREIRQQRLIATEACRQASNGDVFLARVKEETGLDLEVVTRETEARLAAEGCGSLMDNKSDGAVMFDIGGGSTELILVNGNKRRRGNVADRIVDWTSLPMGVVTLAERLGGMDVTTYLFSNMVKSVVDEIGTFEGRNKLDSIFQAGYAHLLGTSGTVTTLAGIHLGLQRYDRRKVDGLWLKSEEIDTVIKQLLGMNYRQRAGNPCIGTERADLVLAGCAILEAIRMVWPCERLRVADRGLREGLLAEMMNADGVWRRHWRRRKPPFKKSRANQ